MIEFRLPSLGSDMVEGKLLEWKVKPGDRVKRGDVVAVVDTTKAAIEIEIWEVGTVHELVVQPGAKVPVGTVLALLLAPGESAAAAVRPAQARQRVSPAARKRAAELEIDLAGVPGTGPEGAVTVEDVEKAGKPPAAIDKPLEMRRAIAAAMSRAKREIPHYYLSETIPLARASQWLASENAKRPLAGRLLMAVLQLKAVGIALKKFPDLNGFWRDGAYRPSGAIHIGVAISLREGGLIAPAVHDVPAKTLDELMKSLADLVKRARAGSLRSSEITDPTITVTNLGEGGAEATFAIIYPPQVAIVGFGRVAPRPWAEGDAVRVLPTVVASLSADHRASDGRRGALFLAEVARLLQEPQAL
ncbi:MAG: dihydrolipoamide acetyltransferase family protein [Pseudomonadota bacterium]